MLAKKQKTFSFSLFALNILSHLLILYSILPAVSDTIYHRPQEWVSFLLILLSGATSVLLFWRYCLQPVSGLFLMSVGLSLLALLEVIGQIYPSHYLAFNSKYIGIPAFGKMICASAFLMAAATIERTYQAGRMARGMGNDLLVLVMVAGALLLAAFYLPFPGQAADQLVPAAFFLAAGLIFLFRYLRFWHMTYSWLTLSSFFLFFWVLLVAYGIGRIGPIPDFPLLDAFLGFVAILIALLDDGNRFLSKERILRGELERSVFETQSSLSDLESILLASQIGRGEIDKNTKIMDVNTALLKMTGYKRWELKGKQLSFLFDADSKDKMVTVVRSLQGGKPGRFDAPISHKSGRPVFCEVMINPHMIGRRFTGGTFLIHDLSTWKEEEDDLRQEVRRLTESLAEKERKSTRLDEELEENKAFYNTIISAIQKVVIVVNNRGQCIYINQYGLSLMGYQPKEISQIKVPAFFRDIGNVRADYGESINVELNDYEYTLRTRDGQPLDCLWNVRFLFNKKGKRIGVFGIGSQKNPNVRSDSAESDHRTAESLRLREQIDRILNATKGFTMNCNSRKFLSAMCSFLVSLGWRSVVFVIRDFKTDKPEIAASAGTNRAESLIDDLLAGKDRKYLREDLRVGRSFRVPRGDGKKTSGESILTRIDNGRKEIGWLICSNPKSRTDADEQAIKTLEAVASYSGALWIAIHDLFQSTNEIKALRRNDQMKTGFLAHLSHELRTPLSAILSISDGLLNLLPGKLNNEQQKQIKLVQKNGETLLQVVNDLLEMMKMDAGESELSFSYFKISDMVHSLTSSLDSLRRDKDLKLDVKIQRGVPERIFGDRGKIMSILSNFLSNAIKFTERGKVVLTIKVEQNKSNLRLSVQDTGIGIPAGELEDIFEEYRQLEPAKASTKGSGLGLPIAKKNAELLGGYLEVKSRKGRGSQFDVVLPIMQIGEIYVAGDTFDKSSTGTDDLREPILGSGASKRRFRRKAKTRKGQLTSSEKFERNGTSVLLIDDDEGTSHAIKFSLEDAGFRVFSSNRSDEGIKLATKEQPAVILMDMILPGKLDGLQATRKLKSMKRTKDIPIIATTARASKTDKLRALDAGCSDYIVKPFDFNELLERLKRQIKTGR